MTSSAQGRAAVAVVVVVVVVGMEEGMRKEGRGEKHMRRGDEVRGGDRWSRGRSA